MLFSLLSQYCGITILIDVCSNKSNREEKKDGGDVKQGEMLSRIINSSSPSFPTSLFGPHLAGQMSRGTRSRAFVRQYVLGATHSDGNRSLGVVASPSTSSMIVHPRSHSPSVIPSGDASSQDLIRVDSDDGTDIQTRNSPPDTDNDDGMQDMSQVHSRMTRTDTDNDIDVGGGDAVDDDGMVNVD